MTHHNEGSHEATENQNWSARIVDGDPMYFHWNGGAQKRRPDVDQEAEKEKEKETVPTPLPVHARTDEGRERTVAEYVAALEERDAIGARQLANAGAHVDVNENSGNAGVL